MTQADSPQILALKERYKSSFLEKIAEISECLDAVQAEQASREDVIKLRDLLHKLAGSSGMYGYDDISVASRSAMRAAEKNENLKEIRGLVASVADLISLLESHC